MKRSDPLTKKEWAEMTSLYNDLSLLAREDEIPRKFRDRLDAMSVVVKRMEANHDMMKHTDHNGFVKVRGVEHQFPNNAKEQWEAIK